MKEKSILDEEMDQEILERMPLWFRKLREAYLDERKRKGSNGLSA